MRFSERQLSKLKPSSPHTHYYAPRLTLSSTSYRHRLVEASEVIRQNQRMEKKVVERVRLVSMPGVAQQKLVVETCLRMGRARCNATTQPRPPLSCSSRVTELVAFLRAVDQIPSTVPRQDTQSDCVHSRPTGCYPAIERIQHRGYFRRTTCIRD